MTLAHPFRGLVDKSEPEGQPLGLRRPHAPRRITLPTRRAPASSTPPPPTATTTMCSAASTASPMTLQRHGGQLLSATDLPLFGGKAIFTPEGKEGPANVEVIKALHAAGALFAKAKLRHSYPHSWRSKAPVIYRNTPQWFVAIDKPLEDGLSNHGSSIRERALNSIDRLVKWTPQSGRNRLYSMIENRPDWVLSRQRAWGVPLTCFVRRRDDGSRRAPARPRPSTPASSRPSRPRAPTPGSPTARPSGSSAPSTTRPNGAKSPTSSTSGSTRARPTPSRSATATTACAPPRSTSRAPTSTAAGSSPRCSRPAAPWAARPTRRC
jgi:hypothetical protein